MKSLRHLIARALCLSLMLTLLCSFTQDDKNIRTTEDGTIVVNTKKLGSKIFGYRDWTPVDVYVKDGRILKVEALENYETPAYFEIITTTGLLDRWNGLTLKEAADLHVDASSGATISSKAIIGNVQAAITYLLGLKEGK